MWNGSLLLLSDMKHYPKRSHASNAQIFRWSIVNSSIMLRFTGLHLKYSSLPCTIPTLIHYTVCKEKLTDFHTAWDRSSAHVREGEVDYTFKRESILTPSPAFENNCLNWGGTETLEDTNNQIKKVNILLVSGADEDRCSTHPNINFFITSELVSVAPKWQRKAICIWTLVKMH